MKLIHVTTVPESLCSFFEGQMQYMQRMGFEVQAISSNGPALEEFQAKEKVRVQSVSMTRSITPLQDVKSLFQIWKFLRRCRPQIVHAHTPKGGLIGMLASFLANVPVRIYHIHGLPFVTAAGWKRKLLILTEKVSCLTANRVLCVSDSIQAYAAENGICMPGKMKTLLNGSINGIDSKTRFNPLRFSEVERAKIRAQYKIPDNRLVIGFVGRITRDKGIGDLAAAWEKLREMRKDVDLLLVGPAGTQDAVSASVIETLESDPRVHFAGLILDISPLLSIMDVLVLPSHREGFGLATLEAAAMEVPVVATRIPGCVDAVEDGTTGTLVPPKSPQDLEKALCNYIDHPELRRRHGQEGRKRAVALFDQDAMWQALFREYLELTQKAGISAMAKFSN